VDRVNSNFAMGFSGDFQIFIGGIHRRMSRKRNMLISAEALRLLLLFACIVQANNSRPSARGKICGERSRLLLFFLTYKNNFCQLYQRPVDNFVYCFLPQLFACRSKRPNLLLTNAMKAVLNEICEDKIVFERFT